MGRRSHTTACGSFNPIQQTPARAGLGPKFQIQICGRIEINIGRAAETRKRPSFRGT